MAERRPAEAQSADGRFVEFLDVERRVAPRRLTYQPALDGVRAVAVILVVVFHLDVGLLSGGYLGVSVFFTLSGFLITSLLMESLDLERGPGSKVDLGHFYLRRIKRLVPASIATLLGVIVLASIGLLATTATLRGDVTAAAWNVFNWRELTSGDSYADLFVDESPVAHFWSLAIEEQFYLVWPLALVVLTRVLRLSRRGLLVALSAMYVAAFASAVSSDADVTYLATHTRAAEILAGAILGVWMSTYRSDSWPRWWRHLAFPALVSIIVASVLTPSTSGWAYAGGLPIFALVSTALIAGLQAPGRVRVVMSSTPLVALGRISYGVYLIHWPVFVVLDDERLGAGGWSLAAARLFVTFTLALACYFGLERPIRLSKRTTRPSIGVLAAIGAILTVTVAAALMLVSPPVADPAPVVLGAPAAVSVAERADPVEIPSVVGVAQASTRAAGEGPTAATTPTPTTTPTTTPTPTPTTTPSTTPEPEPPVTVAVFGDSVPAWLLRDAAASFVRSDAVLLNGAQEGCDGMVGLPLGRDRRATEFGVPDGCFDWTTSYPATLQRAPHTDVSLLVLGQAPVLDRLIDGEWHGPCDSLDWYLDDVARRIDYVRQAGTRPILAIPARFGERITYIVADDHRERIDCIRSALTDTATALDVEVIDLDEFLCPADDCEALRTIDGVHVDPGAAPAVLDALVDRVIEDWRVSAHA